MARRRMERLGHWRGVADDGSDALVSVSKSGRSFSIGYKDRDHLCHPSVRTVKDTGREAMLVFHVRTEGFEPVGYRD